MKIYSITEASRLMGVTRQAIYVAITKAKRLEAYKIGARWKVNEEALDRYKGIKYKRFSETGFYYLPEAAKKLGISAQRLYYLVRIGKIKCVYNTIPYLIDEKELEEKKDLIMKYKKTEKSVKRAAWKINSKDVYQKVG